MQKSEKKLNANTVGGDAYIDPLNQKGITLIALIITIIVMMILVGVTVAVAINGGLFETADDATTKTEKHAIYDQIVGAMELADNGKINVAETYEAVEGNFSEKISETEWNEDNTEVTFKVTGKKGAYKYKITGTEIKIIEENEGQKDVVAGKTLNSHMETIWQDVYSKMYCNYNIGNVQLTLKNSVGDTIKIGYSYQTSGNERIYKSSK